MTWKHILSEERDHSGNGESHQLNPILIYMEKLFSPDLIIIGGGVSSSPEKFFQYLDLNTNVVAAKLGSSAGIVGAALSIKSI